MIGKILVLLVLNVRPCILVQFRTYPNNQCLVEIYLHIFRRFYFGNHVYKQHIWHDFTVRRKWKICDEIYEADKSSRPSIKPRGTPSGVATTRHTQACAHVRFTSARVKQCEKLRSKTSY